MATTQELETRIAALRAQEQQLQAQFAQFDVRQRQLFAEQRALAPELARQRQIILDPNATEAQKNAAVDRATAIENQDRAIGREVSQSSRDSQQFIDTQINPVVQQRQDLEQQLRVARQREQAATQQRARDNAGTPTVNSGAVVVDAQTARNSGASPVLPVGTPLPPLTPSNARPTPTEISAESGTNAPLRSTTQTQSTDQTVGQGAVYRPPGRYDPNADPGSIDSIIDQDTGVARLEIVTNSQAGVGADGDDQRTNTTPSEETNQTRTRLDALYGGDTPPITAQTNILSNFASYTYSLSWYLVDPVAYQELVTQQRRSLNGFYLLVQSAGVGQGTSRSVADNQQLTLNQQNPQVTAASAGRNQFFPLDYYIDNLETEVLYPAGGESQSAAAFRNLSFTVTEPNGLTLLPNLYRACEDLIKQGGELFATNDQVNYAAAMFCMVIRFYGYDDNGILQTPITTGRSSTDRDAVVEKFIPFVLKKIDFSVGARMVEYTIEGGTPEVVSGLATNRGSIPQNFDFSGVTVQDILVGASAAARLDGAPRDGRQDSAIPGTQELPPLPPTADSAPRPVTDSVATGLVAALTAYQQRLLQEGKISKVDVYEIKFADSILSDATVAPPGGLNKNRVGGNTTNTAADQKLPEKTAISPATRARSVTAGTQIIQFIDETLRNSSYIVDQQAVIFDEKTKEYKKNGKPAQQFAWFQVTQVSTLLDYDQERNDYAYKMTFYITPYEVPMISEYFAPSGFRGVHKRYNWLFTGENTEVLNFEQSFDKLWTQALTADTNILQSIQQQKRQMNSREQWKRHSYAASGQSSQGGEGKVFEAGANAADYLYGPNYAGIQLNIIGDPAWVPSAYYEYNTNTFTSAPFWPDGTVNSQASIPYFELAFNRPVDYNLNTGLMDPGQKNYFADRDNGTAGQAAESQSYVAVRCKSLFKNGRFSQELEGAWMWDQTINEPNNERTAQTPPVTNPGLGSDPGADRFGLPGSPNQTASGGFIITTNTNSLASRAGRFVGNLLGTRPPTPIQAPATATPPGVPPATVREE